MKKNSLLQLAAVVIIVATIATLSCQKIADIRALTPAGAIGSSSGMGSLGKLTIVSSTTPAAVDGVNVKEHAYDGTISTHWSGQNDSSGTQTITFNLGAIKNVALVKIAFYTGGIATRTSTFDLAVSQDGASGWVTVVSNKVSVAGDTTLESFDFGDLDGQYVRITGHGNNTGNGWNSYSEVEVWGYSLAPDSPIKFPILGGYVTSTAPLDPGNGPENVVDGNFSTRWSGLSTAPGSPQYLNINLSATDTIDFVKIAFYTGGVPNRTTLFSVEVSTDTIHWTTVVPQSRSSAVDSLEIFDFADIVGKYVRVSGYGNNTNNWNSITEVQVWGRPVGHVTTIADWETGDRSQWYYGFVGSNEATQIAYVTSPVRQGRYAAEFTLHPYDTTPGYGTEHAEVEMWGESGTHCVGYHQEKLGDDFYYGWSTYFPTSWVRPNTNTVSGWGTFAQWHANNGIKPPISFNASDDSLTMDMQTGTIDSGYFAGSGGYHWRCSHVFDTALLHSLSKGHWHDFIVHIKYKPDSTGTIEVWHRVDPDFAFVRILSKTNIPTMQWAPQSTDYVQHDPSGGSNPGGTLSDAFTKGSVVGWASDAYIKFGLYRAAEPYRTVSLYNDNFMRGTDYSAIRARFN